MRFTESQVERYSRHILLGEVGGRGQARLLDACVALDGVAGAGAVAALYLAAAGIGRLRVTDAGRVTAADVATGFAFRDRDRGLARIEVLAGACGRLNPDVRVLTETETEAAGGADARIVTSDGAGDGGRSWYGTVRGAVGVVGSRSRRPLCQACDALDPWPAATAWTGAILAVEAVKEVLGVGTPLAGALRYDAGAGRVSRARDGLGGCPACGDPAARIDGTSAAP